MVLPLIDEHKPKCYLCHEGFENIEELKNHHNIKHKEFFESNENQVTKEPAPGDVTVF
jgi:hypothetical protein